MSYATKKPMDTMNPIDYIKLMALRIENKYKSLGGKIKYNSRVKDIVVQNNEAKGIILESGEHMH